MGKRRINEAKADYKRKSGLRGKGENILGEKILSLHSRLFSLTLPLNPLFLY